MSIMEVVPGIVLDEIWELTKGVNAAIAKRKQFLDTQMAEFCKFKIGDPIYNLDSHKKVGTVRSLFRAQSGMYHGALDTSLNVDIIYSMVENSEREDQTANHSTINFGTKEELEAILNAELAALNKE